MCDSVSVPSDIRTLPLKLEVTNLSLYTHIFKHFSLIFCIQVIGCVCLLILHTNIYRCIKIYLFIQAAVFPKVLNRKWKLQMKFNNLDFPLSQYSETYFRHNLQFLQISPSFYVEPNA